MKTIINEMALMEIREREAKAAWRNASRNPPRTTNKKVLATHRDHFLALFQDWRRASYDRQEFSRLVEGIAC